MNVFMKRMPCPVCKNCIMHAVRVEIEYDDEPIIFSVGDFRHEHDPNRRIGTWRCGNGHEYQLKGFRTCTACILERQAAIREEQECLNDHNRQRRSIIDDHYDDNPWTKFEPGPIG